MLQPERVPSTEFQAVIFERFAELFQLGMPAGYLQKKVSDRCQISPLFRLPAALMLYHCPDICAVNDANIQC
jgi:hypothetical protein